jgi:DNA-binding transcriptional LysR family regulator
MRKRIDWESQIGRRLRFRDLHVFFTVAKLGSMAKAAAQLGVSAPTVSEVIADLEHGLGVKLFERSPRGVAPTIYGDAFLKRGLLAFDELKQGIRDIEFLSDPSAGEVRIGSPESISTVIPQMFQRFSEQFPNVVLDVDSGFSHAMLLKLDDRSLDLVLARDLRESKAGDPGIDFSGIDHRFNVEILFDDELIVAAGKHSSWARRRHIDLAELIEQPWILSQATSWNYQVMAEAFAERGLKLPKVKIRTFSLHLRLNLMESGEFITTLPRSVLPLYAERFGLKALPVKLPARPWPVAIVTLKNRILSPVVTLFIEHLRAFSKTLGRERALHNRASALQTPASRGGGRIGTVV